MNAHVGFKTNDQTIQRQMVVRKMITQQSNTAWMDAVGGCDDCSTVPFDVTAAGRTRSLVQEDDRLIMRDDRFGSILG